MWFRGIIMQNKVTVMFSKCVQHRVGCASQVRLLHRFLSSDIPLAKLSRTCTSGWCGGIRFQTRGIHVHVDARNSTTSSSVLGISYCRAIRRSVHARLQNWRQLSSQNGNRNRPDWESYGTWENRIEEPILLQQSIKHGIPIPKISLANVGQESLIGRRLTNEDRIQVAELAPNLLYFGIYDGHGGAVAADYASSNMEHHIAYWIGKEHDLQVVLKRAFEDVENQFARHLHMELRDPLMENSGTTATVCLLRNGNELVVANVGDSRAILCRKGKAVRLTRDHEPDVESERERIEAANGYISWNSHGKPLVNGILAMTRSIGDGPLKRYGVISEPETKSVEVRPSKDSMLVLVTDGIISVMTDQEIVDSISQCHDPPCGANFLADQALQFGSDDNASILIVPLGRWGYKTDESTMHKMRWFERSKY